MSTLAYVVTECRADAEGGTMRQSLQIRQGDRAPITVVEHSVAGFTNATAICEDAGYNRQGTLFSRWGVFHRLGVTADGSQVVFEVTDDQQPTVFPRHALPAEQKGIFAVGADGNGWRRLGPASREPPYEELGGVFANLYTWPFFASSPNSRMIAYTDRGPSPDNLDAIQIFTLDLATGAAKPITRLPLAPRPVAPCGPTGCPFFDDDQTITFVTHANVDGTNPDGETISVTVKTDGNGKLMVSPPLVAIPGSTLVTSFQITGSAVSAGLLGLPGQPVNGRPGDEIHEVFVIDGEGNVLQLTNFRRIDTYNPTLSADGQRVFFSASADPLGTNPTENCQIFSIDRIGSDLRQLTVFHEGPHSTTGCLFGPPPLGCPAFVLGRDPQGGALVFYSSCDPFGTNPFGSQVFAMHPDGTGLRQLTNTQGYTTDASGAVTVELAFPFAHPGTQR